MAGNPRIRQELGVSTQWYKQLKSSGATYYYDFQLWNVCDDVVGNPTGDNPFTLVTYSGTPPEIAYSNYKWRWRNTGFVAWRPQEDYSTNSFEPSDAELATQLLADTNPGRVDFSLPLFFYELKDFPRMLRNRGNNILERAADANLSYQFGWKPLISDLGKMLDFISSAEERARELANLRTSGLVRERELWDYEDVWTRDRLVCFADYAVGGYLDYKVTRKVRCWGHVKWVPSATFLRNSSEQLSNARNLALGMTSGQMASNIWNAIPWSWLVDWFANVGDFIEATNNSVAVTANPPLIMRHRVYGVSTSNYEHWAGWHSFKKHGSIVHEEKYRGITPPTLSASIPLFTGRQWSILASLAILKL